MSEHHLTETSFASLNLPEALAQGVRESGFEYCTPIQAEALPLALAGQDVAGQAQTGTGKTAAFLLAAFNRLLRIPEENQKPEQPRAIMLAPTRELAVQIHKDAEVLGKHTGFRLGLVYGGTGYDSQRKMLEEGVDVLIGTPGRLIDYFKQHVFNLNAVQVMVLDEADRMFDLGFIKDIRFLLRRMPPPDKRLSMLFSATLSYRVTELAYEHMNNPQFVRIEPDKRTADKVTQVLYHTAVEEKIPLLVYLLQQGDPTRSLVFANTKDAAENISAWLKGNKLNAEVLSGDVPQTQRLRILHDFMEGRLPVLVATDVAARGLHIPDVSHVFNFDLPQNAEDYVHRIGRTARAGASGDAVSFACERFVFSLPEIEDYLGHKIPTAPIVPEMLPKLDPPAKREHRARHGAERERGRRPERRPGERSRRPDARQEQRHQRGTRRPESQSHTPRQSENFAAPSAPVPVKPVSATKRLVKPSVRRPGSEKPVIG